MHVGTVRILGGTTRQIMAKAPSKGTSVARLELQAVLQATQIVLNILRAVDWKFSDTYILTDSECTLAAIQHPGIQFRPYFSHRIAEITDNLEEMTEHCNMVHRVFHVPGDKNIADLLTRGTARGADILPGSPWVQGPTFLADTPDKWLINQPNKG